MHIIIWIVKHFCTPIKFQNLRWSIVCWSPTSIFYKKNWISPGDQLAYLWTQSKQKWHQIITYKWINNEINVFFSSKNQQRSPRSVFLIVKKMQNCTFQLRSRALVSRLGLKNADDYCSERDREQDKKVYWMNREPNFTIIHHTGTQTDVYPSWERWREKELLFHLHNQYATVGHETNPTRPGPFSKEAKDWNKSAAQLGSSKCVIKLQL